MSQNQIENILIPTDFSKTGSLAVEHAAFMASLCKADLYILHAIEIPDAAFNIYSPLALVDNFNVIEKHANDELEKLSAKLRKLYSIKVKAFCVRGRAAEEIVEAVKKNNIDLVIMGTHGAQGFNEYFIGSNAHKTVMICPCPVITIQAKTNKTGFSNIVLPIDDSFKSRQKVDFTILLARAFGAKIHILGLFDTNESDPKTFKVKLASVEKAVLKSGAPYVCKVVKGTNLAKSALSYSKKVKADLISVLTNHESKLNGIFLNGFAKQIVNHSRIPVMSMRPKQGIYDAVSLAGSNSF
jgi:nucleotide-binding universal stress UspA family protein